MKSITVPYIRSCKTRKKLAMLTAYDAQTARLLDQGGVDMILVGDSLGTVVLGYPDTLNVTIDHMEHHVRAVARGVSRSLIIGDLPFGSVQEGAETIRRHAVRLIRAGAHAIKIEGSNRLDVIADLVNSGVPVMGHLGLTPQSINAFGGYRVQGRGQRNRNALVEAARQLEDAGAFAMVIECVPSETTREITDNVTIPTIGIGAGVHADGQVLVINDLLKMDAAFQPKFVKAYANLSETIQSAVSNYCSEVRDETFPGPEHEYEDSAE